MPRTILLADDSITIQKIVTLTFSGEGIDVVTVGNGDAALKKIHEIRPAVILADIFMPGKNGYEVCEHVKNEPALQSIPVILLVGAFEPFDSSEANRVKADGHLTKPFEIKVLLSAVNSRISRGKENNEVESPVSEKADGVLESALAETAALQPASEAGVVLAPLTEMFHSTPQESVAEPEPVQADSALGLKEPALSLPLGVTLDEAEFVQPPALDPPVDAQTVTMESRSLETQDTRVAAALVVPVVIEESDPLGLLAADSSLTSEAESDVSLEAKSLVVDIWEPRTSPVMKAKAEVISPEPAAVETEAVQPPAVAREVPEPAFPVAEVPEAVEQVEEVLSSDMSDVPEPVLPAVAPSGEPVPVVDLEELIERIAKRVVEKLSRDAIERVAWEVIPDMAELMIKEQVEAHFKESQER
ncbi:MAG TPA: response regulator [Terriglobia bacterium]|nr:response regulator [Terriglobia bacterium]